MTNFEKWKDELEKIACESAVAVVDGKPCMCSAADCMECEFNGGTCQRNFIIWALKEYEEPKINLPDDIEVDTLILVSDDGEYWIKRYFAKLVDNTVLVWNDGCTSFTASLTRRWKYAKLPDNWEYAKLPDNAITLKIMVNELKDYCTGRFCSKCKLRYFDKFNTKYNKCTGCSLSDSELLENKELIIQKHNMIKDED